MKAFVCPFCGTVYDESHPVAEEALRPFFERHLDVHMVRRDELLPVAS